MSEGKTPPIVEQDFLFGVNVIDIGDLRVARGLSRRPVTVCKHRPLFYDQKERRIWCKDCETDIEPFDAFMQIVENFSAATKRIERDRQMVEEAKAHNLLRIAAKHIDQLFRSKKMVPACPHCNHGIFPEDVMAMGRVGREYEQARRNRLALTPPKDH